MAEQLENRGEKLFEGKVLGGGETAAEKFGAKSSKT